MTNKANIYLVRVQEPPFNEVVFMNRGTDIVPCIVLSGQLWKHGRLSNFWEWINLVTKEKEGGYGDFYIMKSVKEES